MNLTDVSGARTLAFALPRGEEPSSGWRGYVMKVTVLTLGVGTYVLLFKNNFFANRRWRFRRRKTIIENENRHHPNAEKARPIVAYNREVCPICLGAPKIGVRAPCGHLLCVDCLAGYCDVRIASPVLPVSSADAATATAPPPCPLCRAPLDSITLVGDFTIVKPEVAPESCANASIRAWIEEYNLHRGQIAPGRSQSSTYLSKRVGLIVNISTIVLIIGLITVRLQIFQWSDRLTFGVVVDIALGIALLMCVWCQRREQPAISYE